jgi:hypothetical protein
MSKIIGVGVLAISAILLFLWFVFPGEQWVGEYILYEF